MARATMSEVTPEGIEVYRHRIYELTDTYIDSLPDEDAIKNRITFSGLLRFIYQELFKPSKNELIYNNRSSRLDYSDIFLLMDVYDIFLDLCCKYKQEYTANRFRVMTGISHDTLNNWEDGIKIPTVEGVPSSLWVAFSKKVKENSELALSESMLSGNLMAYAQLKCWFHWKEEGQQPQQEISTQPVRSTQEIMQRHAGAAALPVYEDVDD